jgi:hypothetical protein
MSILAPSAVSAFKLRIIDPKVSKYFRSMVQDTVSYREKNNIKRNDFMQLLIQIKKKGKGEEGYKNSEQNGNGYVEDKSAESCMCRMVVNKFILSFLVLEPD